MKQKILEEKRTSAVVAVLLLTWIILPAFLQYYHGIYAPVTAMALAILFYIGFSIKKGGFQKLH